MGENMNAKKYIGKCLIIGVTYKDSKENVLSQKQYYGEIVRIDNTSICVKTKENQEINFPPNIDAIIKAPKGGYKLRSTGEIVIDPDYMATWSVIMKDQ